MDHTFDLIFSDSDELYGSIIRTLLDSEFRIYYEKTIIEALPRETERGVLYGKEVLPFF